MVNFQNTTTFRTLLISVMWETLKCFEIDYFIQISYFSSLTVFFWPKTFRNRQNTRVLGWWPKSNYIFSISWNFLTRQSQEFIDYLPLIYKKSLFNMNFQFVRWLVVTTSISSKWLHENTTWYIISFPTRFIFQVCYYDSEKWFYVCGKLALIWS